MIKSQRPGARSKKTIKIWIASDAWLKNTGIAPTLAEIREALKDEKEHIPGFNTIKTQWRRWTKEYNEGKVK
jgi:hypothetical protein